MKAPAAIFLLSLVSGLLALRILCAVEPKTRQNIARDLRALDERA